MSSRSECYRFLFVRWLVKQLFPQSSKATQSDGRQFDQDGSECKSGRGPQTTINTVEGRVDLNSSRRETRSGVERDKGEV